MRGGVGHHPVVHVAKGQHQVGRARLAEHGGGRIERDKGGFAVVQGVGVELAFEGIARGRSLDSGDVMAVVFEQGCEDFAVPTAARGDLDHGLVVAQAEKGQGLLGVTIAVASAVLRRAPRSLEHLLILAVGDGRRGRGRMGQTGSEQGSDGQRQQRTIHGCPWREEGLGFMLAVRVGGICEYRCAGRARAQSCRGRATR